MAIRLKEAPEWHTLPSHHDRYKRLRTVQHIRCGRYYPQNEDRRGLVVHLDGSRIIDVPSFYLALGEAINGSHGYFGGGLDALGDCICGSFRVLPPLTIRLSHFSEVRKALDGRAWCRFRAESFRECVAAGESLEQLVDWGYLDEDSETDFAKWAAIYGTAFSGEPFDCDEFGSYFNGILKVLEERGAELVPDNNEARE